MESFGRKKCFRDSLISQKINIKSGFFLAFFVFIYSLNYVFSQKFMKKILLLSILAFVSCKRNTTVYPPVGGVLSQSDLKTSKERTKNLNMMERKQIEDWMTTQQNKYYPTKLNYWVNIDGFDDRQKQPDDAPVSYSYELYDFDMTKIYDKPYKRENARFGHFNEIKAVENALRYMKPGEEVTLLVPSSLAYGTFGDQNKIDNDVPLIIKLKLI